MVKRSEPEYFLGEKKVAYKHSFTYVGVTFTGPRFSLREAAGAQLSVDMHLETQCAHLQFQELN